MIIIKLYNILINYINTFKNNNNMEKILNEIYY